MGSCSSFEMKVSFRLKNELLKCTSKASKSPTGCVEKWRFSSLVGTASEHSLMQQSCNKSYYYERGVNPTIELYCIILKGVSINYSLIYINR